MAIRAPDGANKIFEYCQNRTAYVCVPFSTDLQSPWIVYVRVVELSNCTLDMLLIEDELQFRDLKQYI